MSRTLKYLPAFCAALLVMAWSQFAFADVGSQDGFTQSLQEGLFLTLAVVFGKGVITSLTPCVYPMIPITVALFGAKESTSKFRSFLLALFYVEGMAVFYTAVGTPFALAGKSASGLLSNPWVVIPIALLLFALAASFFGAFNINLPSSVQTKLSSVGGKGLKGAFAMGLVAGPIAAPCTGPFLIDMIAHVAGTQDPLLGALMLFTYAHGIGVLFFVLALSAASLPKSGMWMDGVKSFGAILLIVGGIYFLRPIFPALQELAQPGWIFFFTALGAVVLGILLGAVHLSFSGSKAQALRKAAGVLLTVAGFTAIVNWYFTPDRDIGWRYDETVAFQEAKENNLLVMIDFGADWCAPCKELEKIMAKDAVFSEMTQHLVPLKFDVTDSTDEQLSLIHI